MILLGLAISRSASAAASFFNIADYGARGDGYSDATAAFHDAIQAAHAAGGGRVYVPPGVYITGPIELVDDLVLDIDSGATLRFPAVRLPFTSGREQGIECLTPVPLIGGSNLHNVTITGRGVLTTDNAEWLRLMPRILPATNDPGSAFGTNWERLLADLEKHTPAPADDYLQAAPELRPSFVRTMNCTNILIEGVHFVGSSMWTIHLLYSDNAVVRNVIIETYPGVHTDGIAVDSSRNVRISDCYIDTGDDGIVLKSGKDADGRRVNRPTENVAIANCTVHHAHGAVTLGSEISGGIRNVVAQNLTCDGTSAGVRIKSRRGRGGFVENVRFDNWTMNNVDKAIEVTSLYLMEGEKPTAPEPVSERTPIFRDIAISHMSIRHSRSAIEIEGLREMPISGLRISDVTVTAATGLRAQFTDDLELRNIELNPESGPAFLIRDSQNLELCGVTAPHPAANAAVVRLERCPSAILREAKAFPGTGNFLSVAPGELKAVILQDNALGSANKSTIEEADYR